ncbi:MAG: acetolactate synthase catalytic subunit [Candidatus Methanofastidiosum methylothiophilum]|uniref:Acetolactate synthase catalytic subunit n=1 Tax=Candidatus Methanofastidiosum methylothiophilum TaxID=1705564 RepID=A0A150INH1_9EURY|nr:MAG: acetolactate synthase catalytic subunit [Candidatus Methanofastidiosum methylthiophilus]
MKNSYSGAQIISKAIKDSGVDTLFWYPGREILPLYHELLDSGISIIRSSHEQCAVHSADGYYRASGRLSSVITSTGPGSVNSMMGLACAYKDGSSLVLITGQVPTDKIGTDAFEEVDLLSMTSSITKKNIRLKDNLYQEIRNSFSQAISGRPRPVHVEVPTDLFEHEFSSDFEYLENKTKIKLDIDKIKIAIKLINEAERPLIISGYGAIISNSSKNIISLSNKIGAPIVTTLPGRGIIDEDEDNAFGTLGVRGTSNAKMAFNKSDLIISFGVKFSDRTSYNLFDNSKKIIDVNIEKNKKNMSFDVSIIGEINEVISNISIGVSRKNGLWINKNPLTKLEGISSSSKPLKPQAAISAILDKSNKEDIVVTDTGSITVWTHLLKKVHLPRTFICSHSFGAMGFGLPAAIGAKLATPEKEVILITGDGGLLMVLGELLTISENNIDVKIFLINNGVLGTIKQHEDIKFGGKYDFCLGKADFVEISKGLGVQALRVTDKGELKKGIHEMMDSTGPMLLDIVTNPNEKVPSGGL